MKISALELRRNLFHATVGMAFAVLVYLGIANVWALAALTLLGFAASLARRRRRLPVIEWFLSRFERESAMREFPGRGAFYLFVGMLISTALFSRDVAAASIAILAIGDSVSPIVGLSGGRLRHPVNKGRFFEGTAAGFISASLAAMLFVPPSQAIIASFFAMMAESLDSVRGFKVEDNITMPLVAGLSMVAARLLL